MQVTSLSELSHAKQSNFACKLASDKTLYPFQNAGVEYLCRTRRTWLADEMGLGKTPQSIVAMNTLGVDKYLVLCPASLCDNWRREIAAHSTSPYPPHVLRTGVKAPVASILVVSYGLGYSIESVNRVMRHYRFDGLVLDEAHYLKNEDAARTRVFLAKNGPFDRAQVIFALSGTPIVNRPAEIFPVLNRLKPGEFGPTFTDFGRRYCDLTYNQWSKKWTYTGGKNCEELGERLRASCMIRRVKSEVLTQLPPKIRRVIYLDGAPAKLLDTERQLHNRFEVFGSLTAPEAEAAKQIRVQLALLKVDAAETYIRDVLANVEKVLIFGYHREALARLGARLADFWPMVVTGATPVGERQARVDAFQTQPRHRVFLGSISAASVGFNLTAAPHVVMFERSWVPGENLQAEDRAHRIGQNDAVTIDYLVYQNSIDERVLRVVNRKTQTIDRILNQP